MKNVRIEDKIDEVRASVGTIEDAASDLREELEELEELVSGRELPDVEPAVVRDAISHLGIYAKIVDAMPGFSGERVRITRDALKALT